MENQSNPNETTRVVDDKSPDLMGYEGQVTLAEEVKLPATSNADDVQAIINKAVKEVTVDPETGKYIYPADMDPVLKAAVAATKSFRDNQSGFTKSQQSLKEKEAEVEALRKKLADVTAGRLELSKEEIAELDELKTTNPEEWRKKLNEKEATAKQAIKEELETVTQEARETAGGEFELQRRYRVLAEFNEGRETPITPEMMDEEVPPRITKKLANREISFEEYLVEISEYLDKGKVVANPEVSTTKNLNTVSGSSKPMGGGQTETELDYSSVTL